MTTATAYYIDYLYVEDDKPSYFCLEFDINTNQYLFRLYPTPDAAYIGSILYSAYPSALSGSVNPMWDQFEFCLERGGMYFGALEIVADPTNDKSIK